MHFSTTVLTVLALATSSVTTAHMVIALPVPYGKATLNNSPLAADGSDYPCKQRPGVYEVDGSATSMALGSSQPLAFTGSATHGGGSCQIAITYDKEPTKDSVFKVIHSIEGGCPIVGVAGNNGDNANLDSPTKYTFQIPSDLPTGDATLAWVWFNKIGNREMYMNCAPVTITGGATKRSARLQQRDQAALSKLPDMFKANIGNGCTTVDSQDVAFPDPGESLDMMGTATAKPVAPTGTGCAASGSSGSSGSASGVTAPAAGDAASGSTGSSVVSSAASSVTAPTAPSYVAQPGVFVSVDATESAQATAPVASASASASAPAGSAPSVPYIPVSSSGNTTTPVTGAGGALTGACTQEGMWNCIDGSSYQQCGSGLWSAVQAMAAGTECQAGSRMDFAVSRKATGI